MHYLNGIPFISHVVVTFQPMSVHVSADDPFNAYPLLHEISAVAPYDVSGVAYAMPLVGVGFPQSSN